MVNAENPVATISERKNESNTGLSKDVAITPNPNIKIPHVVFLSDSDFFPLYISLTP
ncbi:MAG: hypothetical protein HXO48_08985 [Prevotella sp.]|nr:hypothetical protein [Prevotella sp.]